METDDQSNSWLTLPNLITMFRIVGSPGLIVLAMAGQTAWLAGFTLFLVFTEWLDGFLARRLHLTSALGARLDTVADAAFYSALLVAVVTIFPDRIGREKIWIGVAWASYACSWLASWVKFHRLPSYHTWAAKGAWGVVGVGTICLLIGISPWPFRVAMAYVAVTNLEAIWITRVLPECKVDVPSLWHARRDKGHTPG